MTKPIIILDAYWRKVSELFSERDLNLLHDKYNVIWGKDDPIPQDLLEEALPNAFAYVAANPNVSKKTLDIAPKLKVIAEMSGAFPSKNDYEACASRGVEVLSCAPGFRQSVAEMTLAMILAGARGLVQEHDLFRQGKENWLNDNEATDFSLYGAKIGFIGYGSIARETHRLLAPFSPKISAYDPWIPKEIAVENKVTLSGLDELMMNNQCVVVTAMPTKSNQGMINSNLLAKLNDGALLVLISRAHLADFSALVREALSGRIRVAVDVFPSEPVNLDHPIRSIQNVILSPHRAASIKGGRQLIGSMLVNDLDEINEGRKPRNLHRASVINSQALSGVGDAKKNN